MTTTNTLDPADSRKASEDGELDKILKANYLCKCGTKRDAPNFAYHVCSSHGFKQALLALIDRTVAERVLAELQNAAIAVGDNHNAPIKGRIAQLRAAVQTQGEK